MREEGIEMSLQTDRESWLDRHWYWLVIAVGVLFVAVLDSFHPKF